MTASATFLFKPNDVSRETMARLWEFSELVQHWTRHINLVSRSDRSLLWNRHIRDSAQLFDLVQQDWRLWLDLGSGAGFPGVVMAIMAQQSTADRRGVLVESDSRKAPVRTECGRPRHAGCRYSTSERGCHLCACAGGAPDSDRVRTTASCRVRHRAFPERPTSRVRNRGGATRMAL